MARKNNSRTARWGEAADRVEKAAAELAEACEALKEVQEEYSEWYDNLPDSLQQSAVGEKLSAIQDLDLEPDLSGLEGVADMDLPLGFGRD
jgi:hypothetical protein